MEAKDLVGKYVLRGQPMQGRGYLDHSYTSERLTLIGQGK